MATSERLSRFMKIRTLREHSNRGKAMVTLRGLHYEHHTHIRLTCSFSGLSDRSFRLLEVRLRCAVAGLPVNAQA